jgi:predicted CXXCH cytochrome family protein
VERLLGTLSDPVTTIMHFYRSHPALSSLAIAFLISSFLGAFLAPKSAPDYSAVTKTAEVTAADQLHEQEVMRSVFCAKCHPAIYAEHEMSTHGRAFTDEEVRLATGRFDHGDCIICHTPRPIFETGIGMNPMRRHFNLEEGNTCMTCHWRPETDYSKFMGGAECKSVFDDRVGEVQACGSCHRNHGTPYQWANSPLGKGSDRVCIDCHMPTVKRPVAVGEPARYVSSHRFPGSREESQLRRAYSYDARVDGNELVVTIENKGAGHNFPTELKQRSLESLVVIRDVAGKEVSRSRMVLRDPYKRPYGLHLPVNTQIPSGQSVEHRIPIKVANGSADCELHFKLYYPIQDHHPDLSKRLESKSIIFDGVSPSDKEVLTSPEVKVITPESIDVQAASPANLVDFAHPPIGVVEVEIPTGDTPEDIATLIGFFQFPVPEAGRTARQRLIEIGLPAVPQVVEAIGSWDNKTWKQAMKVLAAMGEICHPALVEGLESEVLYTRLHARDLFIQFGDAEIPGLAARLVVALSAENALDRASAAKTLGELGLAESAREIEGLLADNDPDVVRAAAFAMARLGRTEALPAIGKAYTRFIYAETRRDLASAMAYLGDRDAVPLLMDGLDEHDDLIRESFFEALFEVTGLHMGYDTFAPRPERLEAISDLRAYWAMRGAGHLMRTPREVDRQLEAAMWNAVGNLGSDDAAIDAQLSAQLLDGGEEAVAMLVKGLKFPAGFAAKRAKICELLGIIGSTDAVPSLISALRDPVINVATWASWALEKIGDRAALSAVQRFESRILTLQATGRFPAELGSSMALLVQTTRARFHLGEEPAVLELVRFLHSEDLEARRAAIGALSSQFGFDLGYDPDGSVEDRRKATVEWSEALQ